MNLMNRLRGCFIYGAIGDGVGGKYEGAGYNQEVSFDFDWTISDDTQLTLATCEAIFDSEKISPEKVAAQFLQWFNKGKLTGLGASTLLLRFTNYDRQITWPLYGYLSKPIHHTITRKP
ncbi:MAG: hypothetical protein DI538_08170 [Azospira oryzae]|jgi:ADP-ribosyl-[dinitrogen reductase] hydrolase|nr:MAG: hypothetical protein DI538_08170 [Azospira oryzae]